ncbi:bifunctional 4-hydroxy-2-oxoglutarate aldolase/2-dehydro-3-deoxy-phosphogluconate aldolase [Flavobacterium sp. ASW18X]|uniref:bifunctional 4-hydroxy-2-oxoglutarate aldolase/2-dehydro-3-deoxy-phosphogluconate aldolase n=1 Tax=Flavobacterium sp. ASW18X TaxID=2572595 RepID=UPI0010AE6FB6|nr:bifunctional 4-hydroxy-2-oxoglutarate aldolase/2-dehydro-3-deoxy-phosphogluconate aldolase [Flavobacterium sp. ASW18X]TKD61813.1 bifunctional 4-hydroxy-2-oxoglutarate aldolase/2-dehydro-3-deoxy-phosphogluconate aldolase [Flavobacterium sp. ASW18X]
MSSFSESLFKKTPVVGILRGYTVKQVMQIAEVYADAGFTNLEITMNTPNALQIIEELARTFKTQLNIGAGTVLDAKQVDAVVAVGGQFIVSPVVDMAVIAHCVAKAVPIFPGAYSPTEIYTASKAGARMVKVFPATQLGPKYIADVLAPLDQIELMPTAGVTIDNLSPFAQAGAKAFGMGGNLFKPDLIAAEDWLGLKAHLVLFKEKLEQTFNSIK